MRHTATILAVGAAYYVGGKAGLLLAIPPGYATTVWPPSGLALVAVLLYGYRVWPGVLLGSMVLNSEISFQAATRRIYPSQPCGRPQASRRAPLSRLLLEPF